MKPTKILIADSKDSQRLEKQVKTYLDANGLTAQIQQHTDGKKISDELKEVFLHTTVYPPTLLEHSTHGIEGFHIYYKLKPRQREAVTILTPDGDRGNISHLTPRAVTTDREFLPPRVFEKNPCGSNLVLPTQKIEQIFDYYFRDKPTHLVYAEDYEPIRTPFGTIVRNALQTHHSNIGLTVVEDGSQALETIDSLIVKGEIPALITDNIMPGMNGSEIYTRRYSALRARTIIITANPDGLKSSFHDVTPPKVITKAGTIDFDSVIDRLF